MGRSPCCAKEGMNRGAWTALEDNILTEYIKVHGEGRWRNLPKKAGLNRCGKSCRLRWLNYLRPDIKRGNITHDEEELIIRLHKLLGNRWSLIAGRLPGRTDNEIKNYWNTKIGKKVQEKQSSGPGPTHKQYSNQSDKKKAADMPSPDTAAAPSPPKMHPHVVRTKAMRCTKTFINLLQPHKVEHVNTNSETEPTMVRDLPTDKPAADYGSFTSGEDDASDFMMDFNTGELCLSDLLNSNFSDIGDFNYSNKSDQPLMFSGDQMLKDWTLIDGGQPNLNYFSSFLDSEGDWLGK